MPKTAEQRTLNLRARRHWPPTPKSSLSRKSARFHCCCPCHAACRAAHTGGFTCLQTRQARGSAMAVLAQACAARRRPQRATRPRTAIPYAAPLRPRSVAGRAPQRPPPRPRAGPDPAHPPRGIGLDLCRTGISTNSARGPETTGNNWYQSDNADTRAARPALEPGSPPSVP